VRAEDFDAAAEKAASHVLSRLGGRERFPKRYKRRAGEYVRVTHRDNTRSLNITALRREDVEDLETESGFSITHDLVYDLMKSEIGEALQGDVIEDSAHGSFEVLRSLVDDGTIITVLVTPADASQLRTTS